MIKLIIFDLDETLINPTGMYRKYVELRTEDVSRKLGITHEKAAEEVRLLKESIGTTEAIYDSLGIGKEVWYERILSVDPSEYLAPDPTLERYLESIEEKKVLLTGTPYEQMLKILDAIGLPEYIFDGVIAWKRGEEPPKHSKETYSNILRKFGIEPSEAVAVGNEVIADLKIPKTLGLHTILFGEDDFVREDDKREIADMQIDSLNELKDKIVLLNKGE